MAKRQSAVDTRGIGLELQRLRKASGLTCEKVGAKLGTSGSTISRIETGKRQPSTEEVTGILAALGVTGVTRELLLNQARQQSEPGLRDDTTATEQSNNFHNFERRATKITDFQLCLVPGLGQTVDYAHALLSTLRVRDTDAGVEAWVGRRLRRQAILTRKKPPTLHWILTELGLRQPIGGLRTMARQLRHLIELAERPHITINLIPTTVAAHPGLLGPFVLLDFPTEPAVAYIEDKTTGLFLDDPDKVALYRLTASKLTTLALNKRSSLDLLHSIAIDLEGT